LNGSVIAAAPLLRDRKKRIAAQAQRERLNQKRVIGGRAPVCGRPTDLEPIVHLRLLQASQQLHSEAKDSLYSNNWFAITLTKLPLMTFETPYGWDLRRITKLQLELQLKDAAHMNGYVDWTTLFSTYTSLRFLRIIPTVQPKYYDWALPELDCWATTHYIHKAFFRELLAAIPAHVDVKYGPSPLATSDPQLQGKVVSTSFVRDMHRELCTERIPYAAIDS
jgi:hypothetical protein